MPPQGPGQRQGGLLPLAPPYADPNAEVDRHPLLLRSPDPHNRARSASPPAASSRARSVRGRDPVRAQSNFSRVAGQLRDYQRGLLIIQNLERHTLGSLSNYSVIFQERNVKDQQSGSVDRGYMMRMVPLPPDTVEPPDRDSILLTDEESVMRRDLEYRLAVNLSVHAVRGHKVSIGDYLATTQPHYDRFLEGIRVSETSKEPSKWPSPIQRQIDSFMLSEESLTSPEDCRAWQARFELARNSLEKRLEDGRGAIEARTPQEAAPVTVDAATSAGPPAKRLRLDEVSVAETLPSGSSTLSVESLPVGAIHAESVRPGSALSDGSTSGLRMPTIASSAEKGSRLDGNPAT